MLRFFGSVVLLATIATGAAAQSTTTPPTTSARPAGVPAVAPGDSLPRGGPTCTDANGDGRCDGAGEPLACPATAGAVRGPSAPCDTRPTPCPDANRDGRCDASSSRAALAPDSFFGAIGRSIVGWFAEKKGEQAGDGRVRKP
jgi:hypothetical protein